ncbi:MAG TPA: helix-turn-helix domain-containing protein [Candidatus Aminicenantes bacterium]|nr:helix-turn-helix domain-containing protein [Candidatus Aminicenantes bacterium]
MNKIQARCPLTYTLSKFDGKWKPLVLWVVKEGPKRFGELRKEVPDASLKMLTKHLKELETDGMLIRTVYPEIPPRVEYRLTDLGRSFVPVLESMLAWGLAHFPSECPGPAVKPHRANVRGRWR